MLRQVQESSSQHCLLFWPITGLFEFGAALHVSPPEKILPVRSVIPFPFPVFYNLFLVNMVYYMIAPLDTEKKLYYTNLHQKKLHHQIISDNLEAYSLFSLKFYDNSGHYYCRASLVPQHGRQALVLTSV